jgi:hypothetical protein
MSDKRKANKLTQICLRIISLRKYMNKRLYPIAVLFACSDPTDDVVEPEYKRYVERLNDSNSLGVFFCKINHIDKKISEFFLKNNLDDPESFKKLFVEYYIENNDKKTDKDKRNIEKYIDYCTKLHLILRKNDKWHQYVECENKENINNYEHHLATDNISVKNKARIYDLLMNEEDYEDSDDSDVEIS